MSLVLKLQAGCQNTAVFTGVYWNSSMLSLHTRQGSDLVLFFMSSQTRSSHLNLAELFFYAYQFTWRFEPQLHSLACWPYTPAQVIQHLNAGDPPNSLPTPRGIRTLKSDHWAALFIEAQQSVRLPAWAGKEGGRAPRFLAVAGPSWAKPGAQASEQPQRQRCGEDTVPRVFLKERFSSLGFHSLSAQ